MKKQIAWMAGFFEAGGHIGICKTSSNRKFGYGLYLQATITNNERQLLEPFLIYGGNIISTQKRGTSLRWYVSAQKAINFLNVIRPYLRGRKAIQADLAVKFQSLLETKNHRIPQENAQERFELYQKINELNIGKRRQKPKVD